MAFAVVAIDRCARGKQHTLHTRLAHRLTQIERANQVALVRTEWIIHRRLHRRHRGQVHHRPTSLHRTTHAIGIGDIADDQFDACILRQVFALAGREIVQHTNGIAARQQRINQVRADEPGTAGDQNRGISHDGSNAPTGSATRCARREA